MPNASSLPEPFLKVRGLTAGFDAGPVLFGIDLEVAPAELIALVGANGAGKSTLLDVVQQINRDGTALLLVEQDVLVALDVANRAYVLENGRVVLSGPAAEVRDDPGVRKAYLGL